MSGGRFCLERLGATRNVIGIDRTDTGLTATFCFVYSPKHVASTQAYLQRLLCINKLDDFRPMKRNRHLHIVSVFEMAQAAAAHAQLT